MSVTDFIPKDELLTPAELADRLKINRQTLYTWKHRGEGPPWIQKKGMLRYRWSDVEQWLGESGYESPTADD